MKENETVSDLINLSGGLSSNAFKSAIFIERFDDFSKSIFEVDSNDFSNSVFVDGDKVSFKEIKEENISGVVKIGGAVNLEGNFQLDNNKNIEELINSAQGFSSDKLGVNAILYRNKSGLNNQSVSINIKKNSDLLTTLQENDSLYIPSTKDILFDQFIEIKGEVNFPKEIDFRYGLTITDLIIFSGGLTPYANKKDIRIFRNTSIRGDDEVTEEIIIELDDNLIPSQNIALQPDDIVTVNTFPYRRGNKFYRVMGEVALPGLYSIKRKNYSVYDAIKENIEFLNSASIDGISIVRDSIRIPVSGNKLISQGSKSKYNFELVSGDQINIPPKNNTVIISGEVQQEGIINIDKPISAKMAIESVGGFTNKSVKKEVYVEYQNGLRKVTKGFLFFKFYPRVYPGSKVVVPEKDENKDKTSVGEINLELDGDKAPITVKNFVDIANSDYFEGTIFHRVINGFMIQGGGLNADMSNKSSGTAPIQNEANNGLSNDRGTIAMARTMDPHSATSQFFINHKDNGFLNHTGENQQGWGYAVFGKVTDGMDIVDAIADVATGSAGGHQDVPLEVITIESVTVAE